MKHRLVIALAIPLLACGSTAPTSTAPTPTASVVATATATATAKATATQAPTASPSPDITGFGATDASWNAHHTADLDFAPGAVYDADANLPKINGHTGARYVATNHSNGRVLAYSMNLMPGTTIVAAKASLLTEFPLDASFLWFSVKDTCAQLEVKRHSRRRPARSERR